jgi:very-short-patch-repair endonuclease
VILDLDMVFKKGLVPWNKGKSPSKESRRKMSLSHIGKPSPKKGKHPSLETLKKLSESHKGQIAWNKGKRPSEETIKKQRETMKKTMANPEIRRKISESTKKAMSTPEMWKRMSEIRKGKLSTKKGKKYHTSERSLAHTLKLYESGAFPRQENTKPERQVKEELLKRGYKEGINFIHQYKFMNKFMCDFCFPQQKLIIEVDGDFWHCNPKKYPTGSILHPHQIKGIGRDKSKSAYIMKVDNGAWTLFRFWESDIKKDVAKCVDRIEEFLREKK